MAKSNRIFTNPKLVIPVELSRWAYQEGMVNPLRTWVYLKLVTKGEITTEDAIQWIRTDPLMGYCEKTVRSHFKQLERVKMLRDSKRQRPKCYILSGIKWVHEYFGFLGKTATVFYPDYLAYFREYIAASVIGYHVRGFANSKEYKRSSGAASIGGRNSTGTPLFYPGLSVGLIAKELGTGTTMAQNMKRRCANCGFLKIRNQYQPYQEEGVSNGTFRLLEEYAGLRGRLKYDNGRLIQQIHDSIDPQLEYKLLEVKK